jgi:hypothetical protein
MVRFADGCEKIRVLESVKAGIRLPEARFANLKIAARRQQSVLGAFSKAEGGRLSAEGGRLGRPPGETFSKT